MAKKAVVTIETEEHLDEEVDDETAEMFIKRIWEERFKSVGFDREFEVRIDSIENK